MVYLGGRIRRIMLCVDGFIRACLYDPGQAGRGAYRDPAHNTNPNEYLYDAATYLA